MFGGAGLGIGIANVDGTIVEINSALADMMGRPVDALVGQNLKKIVDAEDEETFETLAAGELDQVRFEKRYQRGDGSPLWTDLTMSLIRDAQREPRYIVSMAR